MSIATEIERLQNAKSDIKTAIESKGVAVGDGTIDTYAQKINEISGGGDSYYDTFWDGFQNYGNRTVYMSAFGNWNGIEEIKPKYPITPGQNGQDDSCATIFANTKALKTIDKDKFDFSQAGSLSQGFQNSAIEILPDLKFDCKSYNVAFNNMTKTKKIEALGFSRMTTAFNKTFDYMYKLAEIGEIRGEISFNGFNVSWSNNLTHTTLLKILNALADKTSDTSSTVWTITIGTTNIEKLTSDEIAIAETKGWVLA